MLSPFICFGLNHKTASLSLRERVALHLNDNYPLESPDTEAPLAQEVLFISTCNRSEIYAVNTPCEKWLDWLSTRCGLARSELEAVTYCYHDTDAIKHLLRVAIGLDSMVLGEPQILGQLKDAYHLACSAGTAGDYLHQLLPFIFSCAKNIRTQTRLGHGPVSVAYTAVHVAKSIFSDFSQMKVLLIGAGDTIALVARHLSDLGVTELLIANRRVENAEKLVQTFWGKALKIGDIPHYLPEVDMVLSCTSSQLPLIGKGLIERVLKQRKKGPLLLIDLAVPRDIEAEVAEFDGVYLYNIDNLQDIVDENLRERQLAAQQAETFIEAELLNFEHRQQTLAAGPLITAYRQQAEKIRDHLLTEALQEIYKGKSADIVLTDFARQLTNQLIHQPSVELRKKTRVDC